MEHDDKTGKVTATIHEIAYYNMLVPALLKRSPLKKLRWEALARMHGS